MQRHDPAGLQVRWKQVADQSEQILIAVADDADGRAGDRRGGFQHAVRGEDVEASTPCVAQEEPAFGRLDANQRDARFHAGLRDRLDLEERRRRTNRFPRRRRGRRLGGGAQVVLADGHPLRFGEQRFNREEVGLPQEGAVGPAIQVEAGRAEERSHAAQDRSGPCLFVDEIRSREQVATGAELTREGFTVGRTRRVPRLGIRLETDPGKANAEQGHPSKPRCGIRRRFGHRSAGIRWSSKASPSIRSRGIPAQPRRGGQSIATICRQRIQAP